MYFVQVHAGFWSHVLCAHLWPSPKTQVQCLKQFFPFLYAPETPCECLRQGIYCTEINCLSQIWPSAGLETA